MSNHRLLTRIWLSLLAITLITALLADGAGAGLWPVLGICVAVALKGHMVVEHLMGLAGTARPVRWSMLAYFYLLPPLIALAWSFPEVIVRITTL